MITRGKQDLEKESDPNWWLPDWADEREKEYRKKV